jgi:phosphate transport system substrate-binding protein
MKLRHLATLLLTGLTCCASISCLPTGDDITIQGSGATFPAPLYQRWFLEYYNIHPDVRVNYQPIGSGAGIRQFTERLVNFAASDAAMSDQEIAQVSAGVQLLPMTAGSIALCYNVPGAPDHLRLSRNAYVDIFLGNITHWDDPAIARTNPGVALPSTPITVVRRAEGSGTTYAFTNHLSAISGDWERGPGKGKSVVWPVGIGARGSDGVAALVKHTRGAIGYFELGYADLSRLPRADLENRAGEFVAPTVESGLAALAGAKIPDDLRIWLPDPDGKKSYPIVTYTWILCYKTYDDPKVAAELKKVLRYCLTDGQKISADLGYIPLPDNVSSKVLRALDQISP